MRVMDGLTEEVHVGGDATGSFVELHIEGRAPERPRVVRLNRDEARRLAALILFQAARLDPSRKSWISRDDQPTREIA
jgi:hypothetical protein